MEGALRRLPPADVWLFADADLGGSAEGLRAVVDEVRDGRADLAVALFPAQDRGGLGMVRRAAAAAIRRLSGFEAQQPLSGQRAITADTALRLARFFGTSERFWLNLQVGYDLDVERERLGPRLEREVTVHAAGP